MSVTGGAIYGCYLFAFTQIDNSESCWVNTENDNAFPFEQGYVGEKEMGELFRQWFLIGLVLFGLHALA